MAKVNPETDDVSETTGSGKHNSSFNFDGITGKDGEYEMVGKLC